MQELRSTPTRLYHNGISGDMLTGALVVHVTDASRATQLLGRVDHLATADSLRAARGALAGMV